MTFKWPWQYDFPPFFTLQPTLTTRDKQLEAWSRLILDYCQFHKIYSLDVIEASNSELFNNIRLNRKLDSDGIVAVFEYLEHKQHVEWIDKEKTRCHIYWRRPSEWGDLIYEWAVSNGLLNTPCTLYEIIQGDDTTNESFYGLEKEVLLKALRGLESQRRAVLMNIGSESEGRLTIERQGSDFVKYEDKVVEGDTVIVYVGYNNMHAIQVTRGKSLTMKYGTLRHDYIIGKAYGTRVSATAGFVYILRPTSALWTKTLPRRTQILYTPDVSLILTLLDVRPGYVICESGTGSGSLSHAIAMAVYPDGHLYTHDIEESRVKSVEKEFKDHGLENNTTAVHANACEDGFFVENACDAVFLDLPEPWNAVGHAKRAISRQRGGRLVSFSPCIEQVQRVCEELEKHGFVQVQTVELVPRSLKIVESETLSLEQFNKTNAPGGVPTSKNVDDEEGVKPKRRKLENDEDESMDEPDPSPPAPITSSYPTVIPYPAQQPTHTGYLTSATLLPQPVSLPPTMT
ncbi:hypothetical protein QR680_008212 [Steinernema hermaphroditum]|uniref:Vacuolar protein-sorting-associated protein 25 n=1 Tax=Steinernema hermaphroditum TaxID=289476 RepID=A0AA39IFT1_9BILA|nr:hypothetical protein QR680_008212 [Steinernema hermaphroditum]